MNPILQHTLTLFVGLLLTANGDAASQQCSGGFCFVVPDSAQSMVLSDASTWCTTNGRQLLEIETRDAMEAVQEFVNSTSARNSYFAENDVIMNAAQSKSRDQYTWVNGNDLSGPTVFGSYYQQDYYAYAYLVRTDSAVQMYAGHPANRSGYICEYNSYWQPCVFPSNGRCFVSSNENVTWFEARNRCLLGGGDLAVFDYITSDTNMNQLSGYWLTMDVKYWVGARRVYWSWSSTGNDVKYANFPIGKPNTYNYGCLCLSRITQWQQWTDCDCSIAYPFICFSVVPTSTSGSTTMLSTTTTTSTTTTPSTTSTTPSTTSITKMTSSTTKTSSTTTSVKTTSPTTPSTTSSSSPPPLSSSSSPGQNPGVSTAATTLSTSSVSSTPSFSSSSSSSSATTGIELPNPSVSISTLSTRNPADTSSAPGGVLSTTTEQPQPPDINVAIGAGVGGGLGLILIILLIVFLVRRCRRKKPDPDAGAYEDISYGSGCPLCCCCCCCCCRKPKDEIEKESNYDGLNKDFSQLDHSYQELNGIGIHDGVQSVNEDNEYVQL